MEIPNSLVLIRNLKKNGEGGVNQLTTNVYHHIETSQLIFMATQLTGFYMMGNIGF